jgi:uncharacterized Zn finger protein (UPF0148 family)
MSDFDKEAERERLREKYEQEEEDREVTERMSELLLQGATMTNAHCSECGDPIFRYEGQEFCATCEKPIDRNGGEGAPDAAAGEAGDDTDDAATGEGAADQDRIEVADPSDDARVRFGGQAGEAEPGEHRAQPGADGDVHRQRTIGEGGKSSEGADQDAGDQRPRPTAGGQRRRDRPSADRGAPHPGGAGDIDGARGALRRTLARLTRQAEATDDPREAEAYLSAAREAAETLAALRR